MPVVDVLGTVPNAGFPVVTVDDVAIGREGASHLKEVGHTHFGFVQVSDADEGWALERRRGFESTLGRRSVSVLEATWSEISSEKSRSPVLEWLMTLPRPVGVMACSDRVAMHLVARCARLGIAVPESISVLGADNDEMYGAMAEVPLSSVKIEHALIGYEGAALLERLMRGESPPLRPILVPPDRVAVRASTDVLAIDDKAVAKALRFISQRANGRLDLDDVARHAGLSRTPLQRRFREALRRSIHDEIVRVRLERAKQLLTETELSIPVVAERSGIQSQAYLCRLFRGKVGTTPARFRRDARPSLPPRGRRSS